MHRIAAATSFARPQLMVNAWHARRWYFTPKSRRGYSLRQISPGDRRLLAEFALTMSGDAPERERHSMQPLTEMLLHKVIAVGTPGAVGFAALESTANGDRVIGACACTTSGQDGDEFHVAVARTHREEQIGRNLLAMLVRQARRIGVARLTGEMHWSNRPMQKLAMSLGFTVEPVARDRNLRRLVLAFR